MSAVPISADAQADTLVAEIRARSAQAGRALLDAADAEAQAIVAAARVKAQRQLGRARADLLATRARRIAQVNAELDTQRRRRLSIEALHLLARAWPQLEAELERRWRDPAARTAWITALLDCARNRLLAREWTVRHPAELDGAALAALRALLERGGVAHVTLHADAALHAGLIIEGGGARLDGTPPALLADRASVEATLLARFRLVPGLVPGEAQDPRAGTTAGASR